MVYKNWIYCTSEISGLVHEENPGSSNKLQVTPPLARPNRSFRRRFPAHPPPPLSTSMIPAPREHTTLEGKNKYNIHTYGDTVSHQQICLAQCVVNWNGQGQVSGVGVGLGSGLVASKAKISTKLIQQNGEWAIPGEWAQAARHSVPARHHGPAQAG